MSARALGAQVSNLTPRFAQASSAPAGASLSPYRGPSEPLTQRQAEVLGFCIGYLEAHQRTPSTRDLAAHFGWRSCFSAWSHIQTLAAKGYAELGDGRNFRLLFDVDGVQLRVTVVRAYLGDAARPGDPTRSLVDWSKAAVEDDRAGEVKELMIGTLVGCHQHRRGHPSHRLAGDYLLRHGRHALLAMEPAAPTTPGARAVFDAAWRFVVQALGAPLDTLPRAAHHRPTVTRDARPSPRA
jgi:hypothetical protein